ncbi:hypothetical protein GBAR_LOCUS16222 [Geodia barretti]|uniref:Uncharacterized protein n=1 Tax=Geodia barretti TaxID=519541 RepID=A0AA35SFE9_GEOBA|nr:hypothetical protein GBAR_LOCUS16222 [Geodia barretti]
MREAIHALRCIFWCLRSTQSTRMDPTVVVSFVRRTNTREVRLRVTDRHTHRQTQVL